MSHLVQQNVKIVFLLALFLARGLVCHAADPAPAVTVMGGVADPIVAAGSRVFGRTGGAKGDAWVLTLQVADLKTSELLWKRVIQEVRPAAE